MAQPIQSPMNHLLNSPIINNANVKKTCWTVQKLCREDMPNVPQVSGKAVQGMALLLVLAQSGGHRLPQNRKVP